MSSESAEATKVEEPHIEESEPQKKKIKTGEPEVEESETEDERVGLLIAVPCRKGKKTKNFKFTVLFKNEHQMDCLNDDYFAEVPFDDHLPSDWEVDDIAEPVCDVDVDDTEFDIDMTV